MTANRAIFITNAAGTPAQNHDGLTIGFLFDASSCLSVGSAAVSVVS